MEYKETIMSCKEAASVATPWIGLTPGLNHEETYVSVRDDFCQALLRLGARPVLLPLDAVEAVLQDYVQTLDGFLFTGGGDVDPQYFHQPCRPWSGSISPRRDAMELTLCRLLLPTVKPVLGVCRGFQVMNIALGGDVYQDIPKEFVTDNPIAHRQLQPEHYPAHAVALSPHSRLQAILGDSARVNSLHHQGVHRMGQGFIPTAHSEDGLCEGAELAGERFFVGVQWHPERLWQTEPGQLALFEAFVAACGGMKA